MYKRCHLTHSHTRIWTSTLSPDAVLALDPQPPWTWRPLDHELSDHWGWHGAVLMGKAPSQPSESWGFSRNQAASGHPNIMAMVKATYFTIQPGGIWEIWPLRMKIQPEKWMSVSKAANMRMWWGWWWNIQQISTDFFYVATLKPCLIGLFICSIAK